MKRMTAPNKRFLVIGDVHEPYSHPIYRSFCERVASENNCNEFVSVGDFVDNHAISYHERDPDLDGPKEELAIAIRKLKQWQNAFPKMRVCIGNHDSLPARKVRTAGLVDKTFAGYKAYYETPKWEWADEFVIPAFHHNLWFRHSWPKGAMMKGGNGGYSIICGHHHTESHVRWAQYPNYSTFSLYSGCGINPKSPAFAYGKLNDRLPILSCATIIDGQPQIHRMFTKMFK